MATSVGEAIGLGLERGLRIGTGLQDRKRNQLRQDEQDQFDREDRTLRLEDRQRALRRQSEDDTRRRGAEGLGALDAQIADLQPQLAAVTDANSPEARTLAGRKEKLLAERGRRVQGLSGFDPQAEEREFAGYAEAIKQGQGDRLNPKQRVQGMAALGINLADYRRGADGAPSRIGTAIEDVRGGMAEGGDSALFVRGANTMLASRLAKGVGQPSPYGGTIVGKEVMQFVPVPGSTPEDPKMAAHLRVWVKGDPPKTAEEKRLLNRWRAANPTAPEGATGVYFAPATQGGGSGDNDLVSTFSMGKGFQFLDAQRQLEEWANDPAVAADIDAGVGQWDPRRFFAARGGQKLTTKEHSLPADGALFRVTTDEFGREVKRETITSPTTRRNTELDAAKLVLMASQAGAADRRGRGLGAADKTARADADRRVKLLVAERVSVDNDISSLDRKHGQVSRQMDMATSKEKVELRAELAALQKKLDAAQVKKDGVTKKIQAAQAALDKTPDGEDDAGGGPGLSDAATPPPKPGAAGSPKPAPGKPTVSNWGQ